MNFRYDNAVTRFLLFVFVSLAAINTSSAQVDEICREFGAMPALDAPKNQAPYVYGKVILKGVSPAEKLPKITVMFTERGQPAGRLTLNDSGNYCFKRSGGEGIIVVDVNGTEFARRSISNFGPAQQREDFEILASSLNNPQAASVVSARFVHPQTEKTRELYLKASAAEKNKDIKSAMKIISEVLAADPTDFIAWAKLGSLYFEQSNFVDAESAFKRSLELRVDYTPAWIYMGRIRFSQKHFPLAIDIFKQAIETDPRSARAYQLLGESYLQAKMGTLGAEALQKAIDLDPQGMAEVHLLLAKLYDLAGAKDLAAREYKLFMSKVPDHPDRAKLQKYIDQHENK